MKVIYNEEGQIDIKRELRYREYRRKHGLESSLIPEYYGQVQTNQGLGYIFDYVCDYDGHISWSLMDYIEHEDVFASELQQIIPLMQKLVACLFQDRIISMGITPENIILQKVNAQEKKIWLITDLGVSEKIPLVLWFDVLAEKKIKRHYEKMLQDFVRHWPSEPMRQLVAALKEESFDAENLPAVR